MHWYLFLLQSGETLSLGAIAALWAPCFLDPLSKEEQPSEVCVTGSVTLVPRARWCSWSRH